MKKNSILTVLKMGKKHITKIQLTTLLVLFIVFVFGGPIASFVFAGTKGTQGGPDDIFGDFGEAGYNQGTMLYAVSPSKDIFSEEGGSVFSSDGLPELYLVKSAIFLNSGSVSENNFDGHNNGILKYKVQAGDSLLRIASQFGVSVNTLVWANGINKNSKLQNGDELIILPVSGVLYESKPGDTLESISGSFGIPVLEILRVNNINTPGEIMPGDKIIIPNGKPIRSLSTIASESQSNLPSLAGFFSFPMPKGSLNWGILHPNNAVDIANVCGTEITAAAPGILIKEGDPNSWNGGYGGYLVLEHQNGTETLYAHTQENLVEVGAFITQGQAIAKVGKTGKATGCHVHFEVHGAKNPFAK